MCWGVESKKSKTSSLSSRPFPHKGIWAQLYRVSRVGGSFPSFCSGLSPGSVASDFWEKMILSMHSYSGPQKPTLTPPLLRVPHVYTCCEDGDWARWKRLRLPWTLVDTCVCVHVCPCVLGLTLGDYWPVFRPSKTSWFLLSVLSCVHTNKCGHLSSVPVLGLQASCSDPVVLWSMARVQVPSAQISSQRFSHVTLLCLSRFCLRLLESSCSLTYC